LAPNGTALAIAAMLTAAATVNNAKVALLIGASYRVEVKMARV
jgi:hypothetical protein